MSNRVGLRSTEPSSWTPDQIRQFQDYWDTEFTGDLARRRKAKFVPGDTAVKVHQTKEPEHKDDFDEWLARIICYAFSVPPQWAVKLMNRATAENQSVQAEDEGLAPTKEWVKDLCDEIIAEEFASPDLELVWLAEGDSDLGTNEAALESRVKLGALTLNELRDALGLDPYANPAADRPMVLTATGYVPIEAGAGGEGMPAEGPGTSTIPKYQFRKFSLTDGTSAAALLQKHGYNPAEPRIPKHQTGGGKWTTDGAQFAASDTNDAASILHPRGGHHFVPRAVYKDLPLKPEAKKVFDDARTGSLESGRHGWSSEHDAYNQAVAKALKGFLAKNGLQPEDMTPEQAQQFVFDIVGSSDPRIRDLNLRLYRREIVHYILHHMLLIEGPLEIEGGSDD